MKILLVGGTGILSTDICIEALKQGHVVYLLNRGTRKSFIAKGAIELIGDIRKPENARNAIKGLSFDIVVDFLSFHISDLQMTLSIFEGKFKQFYFISSATAYHNEGQVISEDTPLGNEDWDYALGKKECEIFLKDEASKKGFEYTIIRPYVTYGKTRVPYALIPGRWNWTLINRMKCGKPIVMWDDGSATCPLTNTKDFAKAVVGLFGNPKAVNQAFHITTDERHTWDEYLSMIKDAAHCSDAPVIYIPAQKIIKFAPRWKGVLTGDKNKNWTFDNSKIKDALPGFKCEISFCEGIEETIRFYENNPEMQIVDSEYDAEIDRVIKKYCKEAHISISNPNTTYFRVISKQQKIKYRLANHPIISKIASKFFSIIRRGK